jgi:PKD repeat protein
MELGYKDYLSILDNDGNKLAYYHGINEKDYWTPWYTGDTLKVRLETDGSGTAYGFKIDKVETKPEKTNTPVAIFSTSPTSGNAPLKVQFTDKSTGSPTSWKWSFGDGTSSTEKDPIHTYSTAGIYTVNLTVSNENGAASKLTTINVSTQSVLPVFPGCTNPPIDLKKDGLYEDINGNGIMDFDDVVSYYENMDWIEENVSIAFFDYNKNGLIDFDDVIKLYNML